MAEELAEEDWRQTAPVEADDAVHRFRYRGLNETGEAFNALQKALGGLIPAIRSAPTRAEFRFGRYGPSDFIDTHTDEGTYAAFGDDPSLYSRRIALIWYLTKNWTRADGGVFIDDEPDCVGGGAEVVPRFNEAVCFLVPRCHCVSPVVARDRFRYSLYGWWYTRGEYRPPWQTASVRATKLSNPAAPGLLHQTPFESTRKRSPISKVRSLNHSFHGLQMKPPDSSPKPAYAPQTYHA